MSVTPPDHVGRGVLNDDYEAQKIAAEMHAKGTHWSQNLPNGFYLAIAVYLCLVAVTGVLVLMYALFLQP